MTKQQFVKLTSISLAVVFILQLNLLIFTTVNANDSYGLYNDTTTSAVNGDLNIIHSVNISLSKLNDTVIEDIGSLFLLSQITPGEHIAVIESIIYVICVITILTLVFLLAKKNRTLVKSLNELNENAKAKEREFLLKATRFKAEQSIDAAPLMFVYETQGVIIECNKFAINMLGLKKGDKLKDFFIDGNRYESIITKIDNGESLFEERVEFVTVTGDIQRYLINMSTIETDNGIGHFLWGINIEKSERQRDLMEKTQRDLERLMKVLPVPLFIVDPVSNYILYGNLSCAKLFGFNTADSLIGANTAEFLSVKTEEDDDSAIIFESFIDDVIQSRVAEVEMEFAQPNDQTIVTKTIGTNFVYNNVNAIVVILQDISDEKEKNRILLSLAESEKEANELKSRFVANVSHEIRTPMNTIIGMSEIELIKAKNKHSYEVFRKINSAAKNLLTIVNDILDFSKIEAKKLEMFEDEFVIEDVLNEALIIASQRLENKDVEMIASVSSDLPVTLIGDRVRLWQVLKNILDNAAKCTEKGHVAMFTKVVAIDDNDRAVIEFKITDTGHGMTESHLRRIFQPFEQFDSGAVKSLGTGLGMTIVKELIDLMEGTISVESTYGKGTTVTMTIPFKQIEDKKTIKEQSKNCYLERKKVLVVDDSYIVRDMMQEFLSSVGMHVKCTESENEALALLQDESYDLALIDYLLDGTTGIDLVGKINATVTTPPRLLLHSAYTKRLMPSEIEEAGFIATVEKPLVPSALIQKMCFALNIKYDTCETFEWAMFTGAKILLCEDNPVNQEVATGMLEIFGIVPVIADDGKIGIEMLEKQSFDLVLADIFMPNMDGHEMVSAIRSSNKSYKNVPIVALTANASPSEIKKCLDEGMEWHLSKPIDINKLYEVLEKFLQKDSTKKVANISKETPMTYTNDIEGINYKDGLKRFANKRDKYEKALINFASESQKLLKQILIDIENNDTKSARAHVHNLKGVSGNLGAIKLFEVAALFESALYEDNIDEALLNSVKTITVDISEKIRSTYESNAVTNDMPVGHINEAAIIFNNLIEALEQFDPSQCEILIDQLKKKKWPDLDTEKLNSLIMDVDNYRFDSAVLLLDELIGGINNGE